MESAPVSKAPDGQFRGRASASRDRIRSPGAHEPIQKRIDRDALAVSFAQEAGCDFMRDIEAHGTVPRFSLPGAANLRKLLLCIPGFLPIVEWS